MNQDDIADQVFQGVGSSETNDLAIWFREKHDYWSAALLWQKLAYATAEAASKSQYVRSCVAALAQIPEGTHPGVTELEVLMKSQMAFFSDRLEERDSAMGWVVELADDPSQMQELATMGKAQVFGMAGAALFGIANTKYCMTRSRGQIIKGAHLFIRCYSCYSEGAQSQSGFMKWLSLSMSFDPSCHLTLCYTCPSELHDYAPTVLGGGGVKLVKWHDS
jgi:hypothetical protein